MENNEFKEVFVKKWMYYYFDDVNEIKDSDFDNILIDEKSQENVLIYNM